MSSNAEQDMVAELERVWPGTLPEEERLQFITWETARRELALSRLRAIRAHLEGAEAPTALMNRLQIGKSQYYKLLRDWNYKNSLNCLVPYARQRHIPIKAPSEITTLIEAMLAEYSGANRISETKLIDLIQQKAKAKDINAPSVPTIRRLISRAVMANPDALYVGKAAVHGLADFSTVFGGQVLVDHSTIDLLCCATNSIIRPTISVVIDNATKIILAAKLSDRIPGPCDFVATIAEAFEGYADLRKDGLSAIPGLHPVLTMRTGNSSEWTQLRDLARQTRFKFDIRRAPSPVFGHVLRRSMITKIGRYQLLPRYTIREPQARVRDNEQNAEIKLKLVDAQKLTDLAVRVHNSDRLEIVPAAAVLGSTKLRLNTERVDWLEFGLAVFKDAVSAPSA